MEEEVRKNSWNLVVFSITQTQLVIIMIINSIVWLDLKNQHTATSPRGNLEILSYIHHRVMHAWNISQVCWNRSKNIRVKVVQKMCGEIWIRNLSHARHGTHLELDVLCDDQQSNDDWWRERPRLFYFLLLHPIFRLTRKRNSTFFCFSLEQ